MAVQLDLQIFTTQQLNAAIRSIARQIPRAIQPLGAARMLHKALRRALLIVPVTLRQPLPAIYKLPAPTPD